MDIIYLQVYGKKYKKNSFQDKALKGRVRLEP